LGEKKEKGKKGKVAMGQGEEDEGGARKWKTGATMPTGSLRLAPVN